MLDMIIEASADKSILWLDGVPNNGENNAWYLCQGKEEKGVNVIALSTDNNAVLAQKSGSVFTVIFVFGRPGLGIAYLVCAQYNIKEAK